MRGKRKRNGSTWLMLDINDITKVCGTITTKEVCEHLGLTRHQFTNWITWGKPLDGKYILVEENL